MTDEQTRLSQREDREEALTPTPLPRGEGNTALTPAPVPVGEGEQALTLAPVPVGEREEATPPAPLQRGEGNTALTPTPVPVGEGAEALAPAPVPVGEGNTALTPAPVPVGEGEQATTPAPVPVGEGEQALTPAPLPVGEGVGELPRRVGITYSDVRREYFPTEAQYITEKDAEQDARLIGEYLKAMGMELQLYPGNADLPQRLKECQAEMVINLVDSVKGMESLASAIPGVLELLDIPYTGADILGLSLDTNKFLVKKLLQQNGVPVPNFQLFNTPEDPLDPSIRFPLISKLNAIHGAVEITREAVSESEKRLRKRLRFLIGTYQQPVLVEEFISGREITAIVLHEKKKRVYLAEKVFSHLGDKYVFVTFEDQWLPGREAAFHYMKYKDPLLVEYVRKAFTVAKMADYAKFDIRLDQSGRYYFIDTNCNPALGPKEQEVALSVILDMYGVGFEEILRQLIVNTLRDLAKKRRQRAAR